MISYINTLFTPSKVIKTSYQKFFLELIRSPFIGQNIVFLYEKLPTHSFFKEMIGDYLSLTHSLGVSPSLWAQDLKRSFSEEFKFMQKFKKKVQEIIYQVFIIYFLTYVLFFFIEFLNLKIRVNLFPIFLWQALGLIFFIIFYLYFYRKKFLGYKNLLFSLVSFNTLIRIGISQQKVIELSQIHHLRKKNSFDYITSWLFELVEVWTKRGGEVRAELLTLQDEAWWQFQESLQDFEKLLAILRLIILFFFGVPSFFYLIYHLTTGLF